MKLSSIGLPILIIMILTGCSKDWLSKKANKNQAVPTTFKDFQGMLDFSGLSLNVNSFALSEIAADGHYVTEAAWTAATAPAATNAYTWSHTSPYLNLTTWNRTFTRILYCNIVLDGLPKATIATTADQDTYNHLKGQALFNRAEAFFMLSQIYTVPYNAATASTDLGLPLRLNSDITEKSTRSTVAATYNQILHDLKEAESSLPVIPSYPTRGSKPALYALLARVYLVRAEYDSCMKYANLSLGLRSQLLDYSTKSTSASFIGGFNTTPANPEILFHMTMYTSEISSFLTTNYLVDNALYNLYDANDLRKTLFFRTNANSTISFKGNYFNSTANLFTGIAVDEVLLMRAECYARAGNTILAMKDLNDLLRTRWKKISTATTYVDQTAANADAALSLVLTERRKELILRGIRWSDLRRLKITLTRTIGGKTYTLEPGSYKYTFPIPDDIIQLTGMLQNAGWVN